MEKLKNKPSQITAMHKCIRKANLASPFLPLEPLLAPSM